MAEDTQAIIEWLDSKRQGNEPAVQTLARVLIELESHVNGQGAALVTEKEDEAEETPKSKKGK